MQMRCDPKPKSPQYRKEDDVMNALQGKNLAKIKQQNMENIKTILYRSAPLSRAQIANQLELTPPTITNIVGELIQQGVVQELEKTEGEGRGAGRKPINIDLVPGAHLSLGVSLGRDATHYCITDLRGKVLAQGTADLMPEEYEAMVQQLLDLLTSIQQRYADLWERLLGVGITLPGIVDAHNGVIKNPGYNERQEWREKPLASRISQKIGLPVRLENNTRGRACAVSLFHSELLGDYSTFAFCYVYWGIACPLVLDNHSFRGEDAAAGEIGRMVMDPRLTTDPCSRNMPALCMPGTLESLSSVRAILTYCREALEAGKCTVLAQICKRPEKLTLEQVLRAQEKGDEAVCKIIDRGMRYLGIALANVVNFINPHLIFLSGPMFRNRRNLETVENMLRGYLFHAEDEQLNLVYIDLGDYGGALGAAACCIEKYFLRA